VRILEPLRHRNFRLLWIGQSVSQVGFYFAAFTVALPVLVVDVLHGTAATFGLIEAAQGVGEVLAGLLAGNLRVRRIGLALYAGNALLGLSAAGFGVGCFRSCSLRRQALARASSSPTLCGTRLFRSMSPES